MEVDEQTSEQESASWDEKQATIKKLSDAMASEITAYSGVRSFTFSEVESSISHQRMVVSSRRSRKQLWQENLYHQLRCRDSKRRSEGPPTRLLKRIACDRPEEFLPPKGSILRELLTGKRRKIESATSDSEISSKTSTSNFDRSLPALDDEVATLGNVFKCVNLHT